jgi:hypothetical protein
MRGAEMPVSRLSKVEVEQLLTAIVTPGKADAIESLLSGCHEFNTFGSLMPHELYFRKHLGYCDFDLHIPRFVIDKKCVLEADIQFKRRSTFPAPYLNRNRPLLRQLRGLLEGLYRGEKIHIERDGQVSKIHYKGRLAHVEFDNLLEWVGECILIDEPHSSGMTPADETDVRNDFVIIRFKREMQ